MIAKPALANGRRRLAGEPTPTLDRCATGGAEHGDSSPDLCERPEGLKCLLRNPCYASLVVRVRGSGQMTVKQFPERIVGCGAVHRAYRGPPDVSSTIVSYPNAAMIASASVV